MPELSRAADPKRGHTIYARLCADCHNIDGSGQRRSIPSSDLGYMIPPLWGPDSFNDGAGMARLITIANFVHFNMPHGTDYLDPRLTTEDAWDVAAYVVTATPFPSGLRSQLSGPAAETGGHTLRTVCRCLQRGAAQVWSLCTDPRRNQAPQTGTSARRAMTPRIPACGRKLGHRSPTPGCLLNTSARRPLPPVLAEVHLRNQDVLR
jgi:Cytochrome C oxidase, cbb3-type, subunit III